MNSQDHAAGPALLNLTSRALGRLGEDIGASYLESLGWDIHTRNFHTRFGEIDIIASDGASLVFVEVKTRRTRTFGPGIHSVTSTKLAHTRRAIGLYLLDNSPPHRDIRIDALDIFLQEDTAPLIDHYRSIES